MAADLLNKLQYKENFTCLAINVPASIADLDLSVIDEKPGQPLYHWIIFFAYDAQELEDHRRQLIPLLAEDGILWVAYPKKSGQIKSTLNRDGLWELFVEYDFRPVSAISIDNDWSAIRFRDRQYVTTNEQSERPEGKMPPELKKLLEEHKECKQFYSTLSKTNQKEYAEWINSAKKVETKERRLSDTLIRLKNKVKNPFIKFS